MPIQSDELLVSTLRTMASLALAGVVPAVAPDPSGRAYHLEVYQKKDNPRSYPCYVYRHADWLTNPELAGQAGIVSDVFEVTVVSQDSLTLRALVDALKASYVYEFLQQLQATTSTADVLDWEVDNDDESNEFAMQQQDKGYKTATMMVKVTIDNSGGVDCPTVP